MEGEAGSAVSQLEKRYLHVAVPYQAQLTFDWHNSGENTRCLVPSHMKAFKIFTLAKNNIVRLYLLPVRPALLQRRTSFVPISISGQKQICI